MADMTLHTTVFPDGSDVGAFAASDWPLPYPPQGEPSGSPVASGTVAGSEVTFTGLTRGVSYWVTFTDPGLDRYPYVFFTVPVPDGGGGLVDGVVEPRHMDWGEWVPDDDGGYLVGFSVTDGEVEDGWAGFPLELLSAVLSPPVTGTYVLTSTDGVVSWEEA